VTGLKYFGKTTKNDPHKYAGSGKYWKRHLKKHGSDYTTEIVAQFEDELLCEQFALQYSKEHNIVESDQWANLRDENGLDGAPKGHAGHKFTEEQLKKLSESSKSRWQDSDFKKMMSEKRKWSDERKQEQSKRLTGVKRPQHSEYMKSIKLPDNFKCIVKTEEHKKSISEALKGRKISDTHKSNLSKPKNRICRLADKKEMSVCHFKRYDKL
jgi:hypothetical protein